MSARRAAAWLLCGALLLAAPSAVAGPYDPALRFSTHRTPHFSIHFHAGEERLAAHLATIAESVRDRLSRAVGRPGPPAHVVLVDQVDLSNGLATVVPWNAIVIYAAPPAGADTIGNTDDWLEYVFTHEYAHIVQLDRSRGWPGSRAACSGGAPLPFPISRCRCGTSRGWRRWSRAKTGRGGCTAGTSDRSSTSPPAPARSSRSTASTAAWSTGPPARAGMPMAPASTSTCCGSTEPNGSSRCRSEPPDGCRF
jgi:hypothetical protein